MHQGSLLIVGCWNKPFIFLILTEFAITYPYFNSWYMNIVKTFYINPSSNKNDCFFFLTLISFNIHKSSSVTFQTKLDWHKIISSPDDYYVHWQLLRLWFWLNSDQLSAITQCTCLASMSHYKMYYYQLL